MTGEALPAEHNGDIWSREATKHGAILTGKIQRFLLGVSMSQQEKQCIIDQAQSVKDVYAMRDLVDSIRG